jgi:phosphatidylserine synthase 2
MAELPVCLSLLKLCQFTRKPVKKVGAFCWLSLAICIVELLICIKFGHGMLSICILLFYAST